MEEPMSQDDEKKKKQRIQIDVSIDDEVAVGQYINMARIFHSATEFMVDAMLLPPQSRKAKVRSRLILSPAHAKFLYAALGKNLEMYEKKFGPITAKVQDGGDSGPIMH